MRYFALLTIALFTIFALPAQARTKPGKTEPLPHDGSSQRARLPAGEAKSLVDTLYILGGPDSWNGSFETPGGQPDWHGWTHEDLTLGQGNHWHVSTYWAEYIEGHGLGNHALYCGDETIPACAPPDTIGGVGPGFWDEIEWRYIVPDPSQPVTVRLTGLMNYDLPDAGWDFLEFYIQRGDQADLLATWTGITDTTVTLDFTTILVPGEFTGPGSDEVLLFWRVWTSADGWDDADCINPSHGACQIDDLSVFLDDNLITFDDFEPSNPVHWNQVEFTGVGDFANLRNDLGNIDPCRDNNTWQVNFVDDGMVVPGTGGTPCIEHCYDPGGWIVNNTGGLLVEDQNDWFLHNRILSPPLSWVPGNDGAELSFDVYRHEHLMWNDDAGILYEWFVRSTSSSDPAELNHAPWKSRGFFYHGGPEFTREHQPVSDLLEPDSQWVQIALDAHEFGWVWGFNGLNGTPAPYFDNVALKAWDPVGPDIQVMGHKLFGDAFPETGSLDPTDLAANSCRVDMNGPTFLDVRGDSLVAQVKPLRHGATVPVDPRLHWVMECNPVFDSVRSDVPDNEGLLRGSVSGTGTVDNQGSPVLDNWTFDLPDNGFFFPGDRLRYYITASDDLAGDIRTSVWPPDTTGVTDFTVDSPFPRGVEIRGLPSITQPVAGEFAWPSIIFVDDTDDPPAAEVWFRALEELGLMRGVDFDILTIDRLGAEIRLDMTLSLDFFAGYQTMLYSRGTQFGGTLAGEDAQLINDWLDLGNKQALMAGDGVGYDFLVYGSGPALANQMGVQFDAVDIYEQNGGIRELQVSPVPGNGVLPHEVQWQIYDGCPVIRTSNAISATGDGRASATLDPQGTTGGPYAALVTVDDQVLGNRTEVMPFGLDRVDGLTGGSAKDGSSFSPQADLLDYLLLWLNTNPTSPVGDIPGIGQVTVAAHPNPFNPQTTIAFELPRAMEVSLDIFDLQGRLVRSLLDESPFATGGHKQVWDGRDGEGRATASGVYFYRFTAGDQKRVGKLTLLK